MSINLLELPLTKITGEFVILSGNKNIIFPQILKTFETSYSLYSYAVYDGFYRNNKIIYVFNQHTDKVLYNLDKIYDTPDFKGFCVFGNSYFTFYQDKCLVINTDTDEAKVVNLNLNNVVKVKQLTSQLFAIITSNPTTIHLYGLDTAGAIASGDTANLASFSYATFANPTSNIDLIYYDNKLYLVGDDYTVILNMDIKDIIYLQTLLTFNYRYTPFNDFESVGIKFIRETQSFYVFYNTLYNSYIYITKDMTNYYFGRETVFLTPDICFKLHETNFYLITELLQSEFQLPQTNYHEITFRLNLPYTVLKTAIIKIPEVQSDLSPRFATMTIETRYNNGYNIWSYGVMYSTGEYRILARGSEFVVSLYSENALRVEEFILQ